MVPPFLYGSKVMKDEIQGQLFNLALRVQANAYAPYSQFRVGAALRTQTGLYFYGANVENAAYSMTICAERSAIAHMVAEGRQKISDILIIGGRDALCYPCGACRQTIFEFSTPDTRIHLAQPNGIIQVKHMAEILPFAFGPEDIKD